MAEKNHIEKKNLDMTTASKLTDIIELSVLPALPGNSGAKLHGRSGNRSYLGSEYLADHDDLTSAIRAFNLPNAVAPGEWPHGDILQATEATS